MINKLFILETQILQFFFNYLSLLSFDLTIKYVCNIFEKEL